MRDRTLRVGPSQVRVRPVTRRLWVPAWAVTVLLATASSARGVQFWTVPSSNVLDTTTTGSAARAAGAVTMATAAPLRASTARPPERIFLRMRILVIDANACGHAGVVTDPHRRRC